VHHELVGTEVRLAAGAVPFAGAKKHTVPDTTQSPRPPVPVFVVDNDPVLRLLVSRFLVLAGYKVLEARQSSEAPDLAQRHPEPIDLLLTDVVMPGLNGFELAEAFGSLHPESKVLYMTGHSSDVPAVREAFESAPSLFMVKPFWAEALLEKIQAVIGDPGTARVIRISLRLPVLRYDLDESRHFCKTPAARSARFPARSRHRCRARDLRRSDRSGRGAEAA
jgi:DNA-binding response OmpR family regulator